MTTPTKKPASKRAPRKAPAKKKITPLQYLQQKKAEYKRIAAAAEAAGSFTPAVKALDQERVVQSKIEELEEQSRLIRDMPKSIKEARLEQLNAIRKMRASADISGSYVAAQKLLMDEQELIEVIYSDVADEGTPEEMLESLIEIVASLPDILALKFDKKLKQARKDVLADE